MLWVNKPLDHYFLDRGYEQKVYMDGDISEKVLKVNNCEFYLSWKDYFNSLLLHNLFFPATAYKLIGFVNINGELNSVVAQIYIKEVEDTDITKVKQFMLENGFENTKNEDYYNPELGIILEDLHDENVLTKNGILYFIDTVFYLKPQLEPMKKQELEAKIKKAEANKFMPDALKKQYIAKIQKEIDALEPKKAGVTKKKQGQGESKKDYDNYIERVTQEFESQEEMTRSDAQGVVEANKDAVLQGFDKDITPKALVKSLSEKAKKAFDSRGKAKPATKKISKKRMEKEFGKEFMESKDKGSLKTYNVDSDTNAPKKYAPTDKECEDIIAEARAKSKKARASSKKSAKKSPAKKIADAVEKVAERVEKNKLTKKEILKMIAKLQAEIKDLQKLLKTAK